MEIRIKGRCTATQDAGGKPSVNVTQTDEVAFAAYFGGCLFNDRNAHACTYVNAGHAERHRCRCGHTWSAPGNQDAR